MIKLFIRAVIALVIILGVFMALLPVAVVAVLFIYDNEIVPRQFIDHVKNLMPVLCLVAGMVSAWAIDRAWMRKWLTCPPTEEKKAS